MDIIEHIAPETLQVIKEGIAQEYKIIPFEVSGGCCRCYGISGIEYDDTIPLLSVFCNLKIEIYLLDEADFQRVWIKNYRASKTVSLGDDNFLNSLIDEAYENWCSDIHLECYENRCRIRFRIDGRLIERYVLEKSQYVVLINQIKIKSALDIAEKRLPQDGRIFYNVGAVKFDVRVSVMPTVYGEKAVMRLLTRQPELLDLRNLGLNEYQYASYLSAVRKPHGMIVISGPTGSGKSTTLYATLRLLNDESRNILTVEDPIEYTLDGVNQVQTKDEIGMDFSLALKSFLRQDPDVIMVGEVRDSETAQIAVRSSLTGHLVLSTLHTNDALGCVSRLKEMGVSSYLLADTLKLLVAQRLIRILCPKCKREYVYKDRVRLFRAVGCEECYYTGYKGRKAIYEVIPFTDELAEKVRNNTSLLHDDIDKMGVVTLEESAVKLLKEGLTSVEEVSSFINIDIHDF